MYAILSPKDVVADAPANSADECGHCVIPSTTAPVKVPAVNVCVVTGSSPCAAPGVVVTMVTPSREKTPAPSLVPVVAEITTTVPSALVCVADASAIEKTVPALVSEKVTGLVASALSIATVPSSVRSATAALTASCSAPTGCCCWAAVQCGNCVEFCRKQFCCALTVTTGACGTCGC